MALTRNVWPKPSWDALVEAAVAQAADPPVERIDQLADGRAVHLVAPVRPREQGEQRAWQQDGRHGRIVLGPVSGGWPGRSVQDDRFDRPDLRQVGRDAVPGVALVAAVPELAGLRAEGDAHRVQRVAGHRLTQDGQVGVAVGQTGVQARPGVAAVAGAPDRRPGVRHEPPAVVAVERDDPPGTGVAWMGDQREAELVNSMRPAGMLYSGEQHVRLMKGVQAAREQGAKVRVSILSAGYGVVEEGQSIAPYEMPFNTMKKKESQAWATMLDIQKGVREALDAPSDMTLILLGDRYLQACEFASITSLHSPTWALCGKGSIKRFSRAFQLVLLRQSHTGQFGAAMTNLKGRVAARILESVHLGPAEAIRQAFTQTLAPAAAESLF